jgi:hypothetical protein
MKQTNFKNIKDDTKKRGVCMEKESFDIAHLSPDLLKQIHLLEEQLGEEIGKEIVLVAYSETE